MFYAPNDATSTVRQWRIQSSCHEATCKSLGFGIWPTWDRATHPKKTAQAKTQIRHIFILLSISIKFQTLCRKSLKKKIITIPCVSIFSRKVVQIQLEGPPRSAEMQLEPFGPAQTPKPYGIQHKSCTKATKSAKSGQKMIPLLITACTLVLQVSHFLLWAHLCSSLCFADIIWDPCSYCVLKFASCRAISAHENISWWSLLHGREFWILFDLQVSHPLQSANLDQNVHPKATHVAHVTHVTVWGLRLLKSWSTKCGGLLLKLKRLWPFSCLSFECNMWACAFTNPHEFRCIIKHRRFFLY